MAVNIDTSNKLYAVNDTGVKFFCSLTRRQAKGLDSFIYNNKECTISDFPGAICYVSDSSGNSIFLNKLLFGDGATAGSISGGGSSSGGGLTEVNLSDIVVIEADGTTLTEDKTLADYFDDDGKFITNYLIVNTTLKNALGEDETVTAISIDASGIKILGKTVATLEDITNAITSATESILAEAQTKANTAELNAKDYADSLLTTVYRLKGSVQTYADLSKLTSPSNGDVYNVIGALGTLGSSTYVPPGTNYVYVDDGTNKYWDPLGGTIDLSGYSTSTDVTNAKLAAIDAAKDYTDLKVSDLNTDVEANAALISTLSTNLATLTTSVGTNATNIATNTTNIETNTTNITNISTQLTWQ